MSANDISISDLMDSGEKLSAYVTIATGDWAVVHKECVVTFERGYMFVTFPGKNIFDVRPREVSRKDPLTIRINSGFWNYGWFTLAFDNSQDTDRVESELRKILPLKKSGRANQI